ncbi:hypothetical protein O6H91_11G040800 [Diphasiastrum complanatum]|uniref:Uncharacterized protein n=1 Tax=Diphasiastrum complanatum TaxID=34168 RepID=A0ACC2C8S1_DIPCM|nr:hypothetical protein O6H91_11G040800 [Diphasiastrum complanatum]
MRQNYCIFSFFVPTPENRTSSCHSYSTNRTSSCHSYSISITLLSCTDRCSIHLLELLGTRQLLLLQTVSSTQNLDSWSALIPSQAGSFQPFSQVLRLCEVALNLTLEQLEAPFKSSNNSSNRSQQNCNNLASCNPAGNNTLQRARMMG